MSSAAAEEPDVEAEIFYSLTTRLPVSSCLRLGPLDRNNAYILWQDLEAENFRKICALLHPLYSKKSELYYQLEMARQLTEHGQDPAWIFARLRRPLVEAIGNFVRAPPTGQQESLRVKFTHNLPVVFQDPENPLTAPDDATAVLDFQDCCQHLVDLLDSYELALQTESPDSEELWMLDNLIMERKWSVESLVEFYKSVVQKTSHPADLAITCYTRDRNFSYCRYERAFDTSYENRVGRDMARANLRLLSSE